MSKPTTLKTSTPKESDIVGTDPKVVIDECSTIVEPSIILEGHENPFIKFFKEKDPTLFSVGYIKLPGTNNYVSYVMESKGGKIVKITCDEPNLKLIAEESAKISFVSKFVDEEE